MRMLTCFLPPNAGTAVVNGCDIWENPFGVQRSIGYLPERTPLYEELTVGEFLAFAAEVKGIRGRREVRRRVAAVQEECGLGDVGRKTIRKLSKGYRQRVGIAQALINDPEVVFFDEPMSGLDPLGRREVRNLILRLRDRGCTVFFSSHVLADAEALCSRVAILAAGQLIAAGRLADLRAFQVRGWELVVGGLNPEILGRLGDRVRRATAIAESRYALELPLDPPPDGLLGELLRSGAHLVSLNPLRDTLEDYFVEQVRAHPRSRGPQEG
jgi:ABC-2 type transport system ATP-binding protein